MHDSEFNITGYILKKEQRKVKKEWSSIICKKNPNGTRGFCIKQNKIHGKIQVIYFIFHMWNLKSLHKCTTVTVRGWEDWDTRQIKGEWIWLMHIVCIWRKYDTSPANMCHWYVLVKIKQHSELHILLNMRPNLIFVHCLHYFLKEIMCPSEINPSSICSSRSVFPLKNCQAPLPHSSQELTFLPSRFYMLLTVTHFLNYWNALHLSFPML